MEFNFLPTIAGALPIVLIFIVIVVFVGLFSKKVADEFKREGKNKELNKTEENKTEEQKQNDPQKAIDARKLKIGGRVVMAIGVIGVATIVIVSVIEILSQTAQIVPSILTFMPICVMMIIVGSILGFTNNLNNMMKPQNPQDKTTTEEQQEEPTQEVKKSNIYRCDYCGAILEDGDKRCSGCGARRKVKKD